MSHDPQITHTQNSSLPENSNSLMTFTRPSRNSPLPHFSSSVSTSYLYKFFIPETSTELHSPEHAMLFRIFMPLHLLFLVLDLPSLLLVPASNELLPSLEESSWLQCFREPSKQLTSSPLCQPSVIYSIIAFIILHCNNLSTFSHQSVSFFRRRSIYPTLYH